MTATFVRSPLARSPLAQSLTTKALTTAAGVAALPRLAGPLLLGPLLFGMTLAGTAAPALADDAAADWSGGPRYSYFDVGYQWVDANYAIKQEGGQHEGVKLNGSLGLAQFGRFGVHVFGEFFDGTFSGITTTCDGGEGGSVTQSGDRDSQSIAGGLGVNFALAESTDIVVRGAYVDISEFETPESPTCQLVSGDDSGYFGEVMVRSEISDKVEIEAGFRYSDLSDSDISNNDVLLGLGYHLTDYLTIRARGVIFDDDTGIEIGGRLYFGSFLGRDNVF